MAPELIFCYGDNRHFAGIAVQAGYKYGTRLPDDKPHAPVWFADQEWRAPNRAAYMAALAQHRPAMATVLDLERPAQLAEVLSWAEDAARYVGRVLIIPKYSGAIDALPRRSGGADVVLAYSVPTRYGGTDVPAWEFAGWPVHLLGGSPHAQMHYAAHMPGVVSCDGNMAALQAHRCRFWRREKGRKGHWVELSEVGCDVRGPDAPLEAFRRSCDNIKAAWHRVAE